ncbi:hypothetical protein C2W62_15165 [Candidatus Entotheonella serta]|nr:hypothetical protein C2W62_15165 [Candidatus Entotheonella serta]
MVAAGKRLAEFPTGNIAGTRMWRVGETVRAQRDDMVADPQVQSREMFVEREHPTYGTVKITGTPLKLSETPGQIDTLAPMPGEHNQAVYVDLLGHHPDELAQWQAAGVI